MIRVTRTAHRCRWCARWAVWGAPFAVPALVAAIMIPASAVVAGAAAGAIWTLAAWVALRLAGHFGRRE